MFFDMILDLQRVRFQDPLGVPRGHFMSFVERCFNVFGIVLCCIPTSSEETGWGEGCGKHSFLNRIPHYPTLFVMDACMDVCMDRCIDRWMYVMYVWMGACMDGWMHV